MQIFGELGANLTDIICQRVKQFFTSILNIKHIAMKNLYLGALLAISICIGCSKNGIEIPTCENCDFTCIDENETDVLTNECIENWDCVYAIVDNSKVDLNQKEGFSTGEKTVFRMVNSTQGSITIADDEFTNTLVFELKDTQTSFSAIDNELKDMNVFYKVECYCLGVEFIPVSVGCMEGQKQPNGNWFIQGDLKVTHLVQNLEVKFNAEFSS